MRPLLLMMMLTACSATRQAAREDRQETRAHKRHSRELAEIVGLYWRALRWENHDAVADFIEDPKERVSWLTSIADSGLRYRSAEVLRVEAGPALDPPEDGRAREATVIVQVEYYRVDEQVLERQVLTQDWYRTNAGWWVEPAQIAGVDPDADP